MALEFGLALDFGTERAPLADVLDEYIPLLELAEGYGFHSVVAGQTFPTRPGYFHLPSPFMLLAALAPRTGLRLGTGVTLQPAWQPLNLAYDGAVLDQLSRGRFFMGIAVANAPDWQRFDMDKATVGQRFDELLQAVKALWRGEEGFQGQLIQVKQGIQPLPVQLGGPPILVGGQTPRAARRAAAYGDGYYAATQYRRSAAAEQVKRYRQALSDLGKPSDRPTVAINRLMFLADSTERALAEGGPYVSKVLRGYAARGAFSRGGGAALDANDPQLLENALDEVCLVGSPETVCEQIEQYAAIGVTRFELRVAPGDMPSELVAQTITLAGEQVIPRFN
ncbi:MAG TPA: LLM class flavin-dependent oxidoreductase [Chloroflexota bacterium]|nr:LLM class flavin-dependent oxidoreductase [Chloroflexota bacterium]